MSDTMIPFDEKVAGFDKKILLIGNPSRLYFQHSLGFMYSTKILEKKMAKGTVLQHTMLTYYRPIVKKEVELANIHQNQEILCVGGGYFPSTAVLFHQLTGAKVTVIDNDLEAVMFSRKVVEGLGYGSSVLVQHSDGVQKTSGGFDVIHIAMQVSPKEEVFRSLHSTFSPDAKLLIRTPKQHLERGYQPFQAMTET